MAGLLDDLAYFGQPWKWSKDEVKARINEGKIGSPFTGLRSGWSALKATEPVYGTLRGLKHLKDQGPRGIMADLKEKNANWEDAWQDNWPVGAALVGGYALGATGMGGAAGGAGLAGAEGAGSVAGAGAASAGSSAGMFGSGVGSSAGLQALSGLGGLAAMGQPQQPQAAPMQPPPDNQQAEQAARMRMLEQMQLQALRQKPNKTLEDLAMLQRAVKNQGLLG